MCTRRSGIQRRSAALYTAVLNVGLAGVALAQTDVTSNRVRGTVSDDTGGALSGVTIAVNSLQDSRGGV